MVQIAIVAVVASLIGFSTRNSQSRQHNPAMFLLRWLIAAQRTSIPMLRAVPSTIRIAASSDAAFRSGIFHCAISRT